MWRPEARRFETAIAAAIVLHAIAFGSARFVPHSAGDPERAPSVAETEIDLENAAPLPAESEPPKAAGARASDAPSTPWSPQARSESLALRSSREAPPPVGLVAPAERAAPSPQEGYSLNPSAASEPAGRDQGSNQPSGRKVDLGIASGDWSKYVDPSAPPAGAPSERAERPAPAPASSTGGLAEALEAHDQKVGLGPSGPVLSAAHEAGHDPEAPAIGTATFNVTVLRTGTIQVDITGASSNAAGWRKVAANMAAVLKRKPPKIDNGRNGVLFQIELVAQERWPNGAIARSEGPSIAFTAPKLRSTDDAIEDSTRRNPAAAPAPGDPAERQPLRLQVEMPGVSLKGRGKVCSYEIGLTGLSGGCDPSNIGARAQRVVSARVMTQQPL